MLTNKQAVLGSACETEERYPVGYGPVNLTLKWQKLNCTSLKTDVQTVWLVPSHSPGSTRQKRFCSIISCFMGKKRTLYRCILVTSTAGVCFALWVECVASGDSEKLRSKECFKLENNSGDDECWRNAAFCHLLKIYFGSRETTETRTAGDVRHERVKSNSGCKSVNLLAWLHAAKKVKCWQVCAR